MTHALLTAAAPAHPLLIELPLIDRPPMDAPTLHALRKALASKLAELQRIQPVCAMCTHMRPDGQCAQFGAAPPEDFATTPEACAQWRFDGIPF